MNKLASIAILCLASCIGLALGTVTYPMKHSYPYMTSMSYGYAPYMSGAGFGGGAASGGAMIGLGGIFELIIFVMVFMMIINVLIGSTGGLLGGSGGLLGGSGGRSESRVDY